MFFRGLNYSPKWTCYAFVLPVLFFALSCDRQPEIEKVSGDPCRDWSISLEADGVRLNTQPDTLTLLPPADRYRVISSFDKAGNQPSWEILSPRLEKEEGTALTASALLTGEPLAGVALADQIGVLSPRVHWQETPALSIPAPDEGGPYSIGLKVNQVLSVQAGEKDRRWVHVQQEVKNPVLFPTLSSEHFRDGHILGFEIGRYPDPTEGDPGSWVLKHPGKYQPPDFFYRVDRDTARMKISPHFQLGQFDMDYDYMLGEFPQYIPIDQKLIDKLELLLSDMNKAGYSISTFHILAGYRSPKFNLGYKREDEDFTLTTPFSQHMYGRAVDMIIDEDGDGVIDDLNGDGKIDIQDPRVIMEFVDKIDQGAIEGRNNLLGGAGVYYRHDIPDRDIQTPYIHVDTRGFTGNLGRPVRWVGRK